MRGAAGAEAAASGVCRRSLAFEQYNTCVWLRLILAII